MHMHYYALMTIQIDPRNCYCSELRKAARRVTLLYDRALSEAGLTIGQFTILAEISRATDSEDLTISALAATLAMDRSGFRHTLAPLIRDDLVIVTVGRSDARSRVLKLTRRGQAALASAFGAWELAQRSLESQVGLSEAVAIRSLLSLTDRLESAETI
jgi:DNA-binding MarR family transcriptional regulator